MAEDPFLERLQKAADAHKRIAKLMALADKHPDTPEGQSAKRKANQLIEKWGKPSPALNVMAFGSVMGNIKRNFPGTIDDSDLVKPARRVVEKEDDDGEQY